MGLGRKPLPKTKLVEAGEWALPGWKSTLQIAPLDETSYVNGCLKFVHAQRLFTMREETEAVIWLSFVLGGYVHQSLITPSKDIASLLEPKATSGWPYCNLYGPVKSDVLKSCSCEQILADLHEFSPVHSSTLKDELRPPGKDARFFRPAGLGLMVLGVHLFSDQCERLMRARLKTPYSIGMVSPGTDLTRMWRKLEAFGGGIVSFDGKSWDANVQLAAASICKRFRRRFLPLEAHLDVDFYYDNAYWGWTSYHGTPVRLVGNPSGHFLTASDNTLIQMSMVHLYCVHAKISMEDVLFFVNGDDLILSCKSLRFSVLSMCQFYVDHGMYLEPYADVPKPIWEHSFCGTHPIMYKGQMFYVYDTSKLRDSLCFKLRKSTPIMHLSKICNIASLLFCDVTAFKQVSEWAHTFAQLYCGDAQELVASQLSTIDVEVLEYVYRGVG